MYLGTSNFGYNLPETNQHQSFTQDWGHFMIIISDWKSFRPLDKKPNVKYDITIILLWKKLPIPIDSTVTIGLNSDRQM